MASPRHLIDPKAHEELFDAMQKEVGNSLNTIQDFRFIPGMVIPFCGALGGSDGKRPINPYTEESNEGFALCDGGRYRVDSNPLITTPDLRDRFIVGAGGKYEVKKTGGDESHEHAGMTAATTLTAAQMPYHAHGGTFSTSAKIASDAAAAVNKSITNAEGKNPRYPSAWAPSSTSAAGSGNSHTHGIIADFTESLPPYFALAYIMKL